MSGQMAEAAPTTILEQSFASICAAHDLSSFHIGFFATDVSEQFWRANAHWAHDSSFVGNACAAATSYTSLEEAVTKALAEAAKMRGRGITTLPDVALPMADAA